MATGVTSYSMAGMGVFGYTAYINHNTGDTSGFVTAIIVSLAALVLAMVIELIFYKDAPAKKESAKPAAATDAKGGTVAAPITGKVLALSDIKDEAFSSEPSEGKVYSPVDGEITTFFPTGHAIGLTSDNGIEILIHVGMDTVELDGKGFTPKKAQGDKVKKGELLLEFDMKVIKDAGFPVTTPVVITNSDDYADVVPAGSGEVKHGQDVITLL
jgi:PTS system beta-glucosides-specific IIC component